MVEAMYTTINMDVQESHERHVKHFTFPTMHGIFIWAMSFTANISPCPSLVRNSMLRSQTFSSDVSVLLFWLSIGTRRDHPKDPTM
uniref:Uncharacterized protein n=1 Tax=Oryza barthii TaxID=65489 RepID=A0A0D3HJN8_9ORYZ